MATTVELYEALKDTLKPEAARMLAESIPQAQDLATKADIRELKLHVDELKLYIDGRVKGAEASIMKWMLTFFVPLWLGVWGTLAVLIFKG